MYAHSLVILFTHQRTSAVSVSCTRGYNQELSHLETCLLEGTSETITGDLLRASAEQMRLEVGISSKIGAVTEETKKVLSLATDCWLKTATPLPPRIECKSTTISRTYSSTGAETNS